jgi:aminocarboxymuconate-semialdehyde decarboxylase
MFYDSNVFDGALLRHLATRMSPDRVFLGTDYPYALMQTQPAAYLSGCGLDQAQGQSLAFGAAERFLRLG